MRLREIREQKGLTQSQLASAAGLTQAFVCELESGRKSPSLKTLRTIARILDTPIDKLIAESEPNQDSA